MYWMLQVIVFLQCNRSILREFVNLLILLGELGKWTRCTRMYSSLPEIFDPASLILDTNPELNPGNVLLKLVMRLANVETYGLWR